MTGDHGCTACRLCDLTRSMWVGLLMHPACAEVAYENEMFHASSSCQNQLDLALW